MRFGEIFSAAWKEYKENKCSLMKIVLFFYAIPTLIVYLINSLWLNSSGAYGAVVSFMNNLAVSGNYTNFVQGDFSGALSKVVSSNVGSGFVPATIILSVVTGLLMLLAFASIVSISVKKKKFSFSEAFKAGRKNYWMLFGFLIVYVLFLCGLFILLIIPGIIFLIYWLFGYFVFVDEKKGIIESLRRSYYLVKGRWWKSLGYALLADIIFGLILLVFMIPSMITQFIVSSELINGQLSVATYVSNVWVSNVFGILALFIVLPLALLFGKNMYQEWKRRR